VVVGCLIFATPAGKPFGEQQPTSGAISIDDAADQLISAAFRREARLLTQWATK
jgi:hypothetical protein